MINNKKYYWLKLHKDFFSRHDIKIIEGMENGKENLLFYLKLMTESVSYNGRLRFSDNVPYDDTMLGVITNFDPNRVEEALQTLGQLNLVIVEDDLTIYLPEVEKMLGQETASAVAKRKYRKGLSNETKGKKTLEKDNVPNGQRQSPDNVRQSKSKSKSKSNIKDIGQNHDLTPSNQQKDSNENHKFFSTIKVNGKDRPDPKDESHPFNVFWNEYPRRVKRINAERAFKNNVKSWDVLKEIIVDIKQRFAFGVWDANEVKYIPHPTTYLNNLMWEDELTELKSVSKNVDKEVKSIASMPTYDDGLKVDIDPEEAERIRERIKGMSNKQEEEQK